MHGVVAVFGRALRGRGIYQGKVKVEGKVKGKEGQMSYVERVEFLRE